MGRGPSTKSNANECRYSVLINYCSAKNFFMTPDAFVIAIASILITCSAVVIAIYIAKPGFAKAGSQSVRFALTYALCVSLIRGWVPGRWITVVLMSFAATGLVIGSVNLIQAGHSGTGTPEAVSKWLVSESKR